LSKDVPNTPLDQSSVLSFLDIHKSCNNSHRHLQTIHAEGYSYLGSARAWPPCLIVADCPFTFSSELEKSCMASLYHLVEGPCKSPKWMFSWTRRRHEEVVDLLKTTRWSKLPMSLLLEREGIQYLKSDLLPFGQQLRKMCISQSATIFS